MTVTVDVSAAVHARAGLGRYAAQLAAALEKVRPGKVRLFANAPRRQGQAGAGYLPESLSALPMTTVSLGYKPWRLAVWLGQIARLSMDNQFGDTQLLHATEHLLVPLKRIPAVLTVHDLVYKLFPQHHKVLNYLFLNAAMPLFVRRASHIIAVSEQTKRDLIEQYAISPGKISVVYEAAAEHFKPASHDQIRLVTNRYSLPEKYLISVGTIEPRKNMPRVVEALSHLRQDHSDLHLVLVGSKGWLAEGIYNSIKQYGLEDSVISMGFVADEDLPAVLGGAIASVTASIYEGFGLPVLEAMACGVPVACSCSSSVGEVAGEAALKFNPENIDEIVSALHGLLSSKELRDSFRKKGLARAAEFSWERAARETWNIYDRLLADQVNVPL